jgi:hypothetical protein
MMLEGAKRVFAATLAAACGVADASAAPSNDYDLLVETCFVGAPTFASAESAVSRAGAQPSEWSGWEISTQVESPRLIAQWEIAATRDPDKIAPFVILEGRFEGRPARSCVGGQSVHERAKLEGMLATQFGLELVRSEPIYPLDFIRTTYSATLNGTDVTVITEGAGGGGFPSVEVIVAP